MGLLKRRKDARGTFDNGDGPTRPSPYGVEDPTNPMPRPVQAVTTGHPGWRPDTYTQVLNQSYGDPTPIATERFVTTGPVRPMPLEAPSADQLVAPAMPDPDDGAQYRRPEPASSQVTGVQLRPQRWGGVDWLMCLILAVICGGLVALHVHDYPTFSPLDEMQHVDYAMKGGELQVPLEGQRVGQAALNEAACRGIDDPAFVAPPCGDTPYNPADFPDAGYNTATGDYPVYYVVTGLVARFATEWGLIGSFGTAARLTGALWLALGWMLMWYVMSLVGIPRPQRAAISSLFIATPLLIFSASTVSSDAALFFCGALVVLGTVKYATHAWSWWWLIPMFALAFSIAPATSLIMIVCLAFLFVDAVRTRRRDPSRVAFPAIALITVAVAWYFKSWIHDQIYPPVRSLPSTQPTTGDRSDLTAQMLIDQVPVTFMPIANSFLPRFLRTPAIGLATEFSNLLTIVLVSITALIGRGAARITLLARFTALACLSAGVLYTVYFAVVDNVIAFPTGRFGIPLLAAIIVVASAGLMTRFATAVTAVVGLSVVATTTWQLIAFAF